MDVKKSMDNFNRIDSLRLIEDFTIKDLSTWYIRRSRRRVGLDADEKDRNTCLSVMYGVLVCLSKLLAPFAPFISEEIFRNLTNEESVHLQDYPKGDKSFLDEKLIEDMGIVRKIVELGHAKRKELGIKVRQPLAKFEIRSRQNRDEIDDELIDLIKDELNVKKANF